MLDTHENGAHIPGLTAMKLNPINLDSVCCLAIVSQHGQSMTWMSMYLGAGFACPLAFRSACMPVNSDSSQVCQRTKTECC